MGTGRLRRKAECIGLDQAVMVEFLAVGAHAVRRDAKLNTPRSALPDFPQMLPGWTVESVEVRKAIVTC